jgi:uncharacterized membrane protein
MTANAHYSKASIGGHPIHPMLVGFPIAFYTAGVAGLLVYAGTHDPFWYRASMIAVIAGVAMALVAAVFGFVDLFFGVPNGTPARSTGIKHMVLNVVTVVLFAIAAVLMYGTWNGRPEIEEHPQLAFAGPLVLGILGLGVTLVAGVLGWKMVQTHHVGIDENPDLSDRDMLHRGGTA